MLVKFDNGNPFATIDRVFDEVLRDKFNTLVPHTISSFRVDISEDEKNVFLEAELPGIKKEDVKVSVEDNVLTIRAERKAETDNKTKNFRRTERFFGSFSRSFTLGENISTENIEATYTDGVLNLRLAKIEPVKNIKEVTIR
ncbi:MAG: Hsp20/alpha crystallin family protein [Chloroherpetonaceae bacterium]|nr:Hsp20/alpha crystallin family protein [Chloroherpetonaceae bacterium]